MRPIDADALIEELKYLEAVYSSSRALDDYYIADGIERAIEAIEEAPTVERPRGEWIYKLDVDWIDGERTHYFTCPFCSKIYINKKHKFCNECGADMRGEGE